MIRNGKQRLRDIMHPLTLGFRDRWAELSYHAESSPRFRLQVRIALTMGISLYMLVGVLDPFYIPETNRAAAWWIRLVSMAYPLLVLGITFLPLFRRLHQIPVAVIGFAPALGLTSIMALMTNDSVAQYYVGLVIVFFWTYLALGIRCIHALSVNVICVAAFYLTFGVFREMPAQFIGSSAFFLLATTIIGTGAAYLIEYQQRMLFVRNSLLEREREQHKFRALHDSLTGLPNRDLLEDRLEQAIFASRRSGQKCAGLYLDLDGFKPINDVHGHDAGDEVLKKVAERLSDLLREADTLARLGGDEFFILAGGVDSAEGAEQMAKRVLEGVTLPIALTKGGEVRLGISIGICLFPYADCTAHDIVHRSDHAMYTVKRSGKHGFAFSPPGSNSTQSAA